MKYQHEVCDQNIDKSVHPRMQYQFQGIWQEYAKRWNNFQQYFKICYVYKYFMKPVHSGIVLARVWHEIFH